MTGTPLTDGLLPRSRERLVVLSLSLSAFAMALNANGMAPLLPHLTQEFGLDDKARAGVLAGVPHLGNALGALLIGPLVDRIGRRQPLLLSLCVFAGASALHALVGSYEVFVAARLLTGIAVGIAFTCASAAVADLVPYTRLGRAMGVFNAGMFLAFAVGMPLASWLGSLGQWRLVFLVQAGLGALALLAATSLPPGLGRSGRSVSPWLVLREPMVTPVLLAILVSVGPFFAIVQFSGRWLDETRLLPKDSQVFMFAILGLLAAAGSTLLGGVSDRIGKRNFVMITTALMAGAILYLPRIGSLQTLLLVGGPLAVIGASRTGASQALVSELVEPRMRGTLMGVRSAAVTAGMGLAVWGGGWIYAHRGFTDFTRFAGGLMVLGYLLLRLFVRRSL